MTFEVGMGICEPIALSFYEPGRLSGWLDHPASKWTRVDKNKKKEVPVRPTWTSQISDLMMELKIHSLRLLWTSCLPPQTFVRLRWTRLVATTATRRPTLFTARGPFGSKSEFNSVTLLPRTIVLGVLCLPRKTFLIRNES